MSGSHATVSAISLSFTIFSVGTIGSVGMPLCVCSSVGDQFSSSSSIASSVGVDALSEILAVLRKSLRVFSGSMLNFSPKYSIGISMALSIYLRPSKNSTSLSIVNWANIFALITLITLSGSLRLALLGSGSSNFILYEIEDIYDTPFDNLNENTRALVEYITYPFSVDFVKYFQATSLYRKEFLLISNDVGGKTSQ